MGSAQTLGEAAHRQRQRQAARAEYHGTVKADSVGSAYGRTLSQCSESLARGPLQRVIRLQPVEAGAGALDGGVGFPHWAGQPQRQSAESAPRSREDRAVPIVSAGLEDPPLPGIAAVLVLQQEPTTGSPDLAVRRHERPRQDGRLLQ